MSANMLWTLKHINNRKRNRDWSERVKMYL